jgi:hypothetical protein
MIPVLTSLLLTVRSPESSPPTLLHQCDAEQFVRFGETVARLQREVPRR